jgi:hypothetical protein
VLAAGDNRVVPHLIRLHELNARQKGNGRKRIAVHRGEFGQLADAYVAANLGARQIDQRSRRPDGNLFLNRSNVQREIDVRVLPTWTTTPGRSPWRNPLRLATIR